MTRLAVLTAQVAAETNQPDTLIGALASNRIRTATQSMFGFFANPVVLRARFDPDRSFRDWLFVIRETVTETAAHSGLPYDLLEAELQERCKQKPDPMIFFSVSQPRITRRFAGLELQWLEQPTAFMPWFFTLECNEQNEQELSRVTFDANLYDPKGVSAFMDRYCRLFSNASQYPDRSLGKLLAMSGIS